MWFQQSDWSRDQKILENSSYRACGVAQGFTVYLYMRICTQSFKFFASSLQNYFFISLERFITKPMVTNRLCWLISYWLCLLADQRSPVECWPEMTIVIVILSCLWGVVYEFTAIVHSCSMCCWSRCYWHDATNATGWHAVADLSRLNCWFIAVLAADSCLKRAKWAWVELDALGGLFEVVVEVVVVLVGRGGEKALNAKVWIQQVQVGYVVVDAVEVDWRRLVLDSLGLGSLGTNIDWSKIKISRSKVIKYF